MAEVKNYGLSGVHRTLQLGKQGPVLVGNADTDSFTVTLQDAATLTTMGGANASSPEHFITKAQLDVVYTEAQFLANVNYNDSSPVLLGNISSGTKTIITTFEVDTAFDGNAIITVGTSSDNSLLMSDSYAEIEVAGSYQTTGLFEFASDTSLNIYVTQGGATQGSGKVLVSVVDGPVVDGGTINYGGAGGIALTDLSVTSNSPSGNGSLSYNSSTGVFTFTPTDLSSVAGTYGDSNVVTLLSSFGSNTISTTGNISGAFVAPATTANTYVLYNDSGLVGGSGVFTFNESGNVLTIGTTGGQLRVADISTPQAGVNLRLIPSSGTTLSYGHLNPQFATTYDLGQSASRWNNMFANVANVTSLAVTGSATATSITLTSTGTAVNASSGNMLTNRVTGTEFAFLNGIYTASLTGGGATSNYTLKLPANVGSNGQVLSTDGTGNLIWTTSSSGSNYGDSNVVTLLSSFGSNTITTTGNISGNNFSATGTAVTGIAAITAGVTNTLLPNTIASFSANVNNYTQVTLQNKSSGADATADFVITANNGSDTVNYADFGIINSGYDNTTPTNSLGNIVFAADTYLYAQGNASATSQSGGNIAIGTTVAGKTVKIFAGGANSTAIVGTFSNTGLAVNGNVTATNLSGNISITGNVTGTSPNVTLVAGSYSWTFDQGGVLTLPGGSGGGNEGGEIALTQAANSTLAGNIVVMDQYVDRIRFFEGGGNARGAYIDLSIAPDGVGALLNNRVSGFVNAGTDVTLGNLKARIPSSGNRSLQVSTVSGTYSVYGSSIYNANGTVGGTNIVSGFAVSVTTTPAYLNSGNNFLTAGDSGTWTIMDPAAGLAWRISFVIGASFNNNMICIERLV